VVDFTIIKILCFRPTLASRPFTMISCSVKENQYSHAIPGGRLSHVLYISKLLHSLEVSARVAG